MRKRRVWIPLAALAVFTLLFGRPLFLIARAWLRDRPVVNNVPTGQADDASRLNTTPVVETIAVEADPIGAERQLQDLLARARRENLRVSIAGARHTMGGHTIAPGGLVVDMLPFSQITLDVKAKKLLAGAGARWKDVIPMADAAGLAVEVMQSNHDFSIGGSISVNCHGWQPNRPPIASTVVSFKLLKADGTTAICSRDNNPELFSLALGGYGLFGIITDVEIQLVDNERYTAEVFNLDRQQIDDYVPLFRDKVKEDAGLAYGRLCVTPGEKTFLREAILTVFRKSPCPPKDIPPLKEASFAKVRREVFRAQVGSDAGKDLRWKAEKLFGERVVGRFFSRNQLMNESSAVFREQNEDRTDILHEYFLPPDRLNDFLKLARTILPKHPCDLLNVTIRNVLEDKDTFLRYADREMFALVMLFNMPRTATADDDMRRLTVDLIEAALACNGRYYLPYRPHATRQQFHQAYPQAVRFFDLRHGYDPERVFENKWALTYER